MLTLRKVAVTGGLGAGKTTFCHLLEEQGAFVISADKIVHQLLSPQTEIGKAVIDLLGEDIVLGKELNRKAIADLVFHDRHLLLELEKKLHPAVLEKIETAYQEIHRKHTHSLFVAEVPLLYEGKFESAFDQVILITAQESLCQERFTSKGRTTEEFTRRSERLLSIKEKCKKADFIITNDGSLADLKKNAITLYKHLT